MSIKNSTLNNQIGHRLKQIREELNMSQMAFSRMLNINRSNYSMIERGILPVHPTQLNSLLKQFQVSADWLVTGEGEKGDPKRLKKKIINDLIASNKEVRELENFLRICPSFIKELKLKLKKYHKEEKELLDEILNEEGRAFLKKFTRQKNETIR